MTALKLTEGTETTANRDKKETRRETERETDTVVAGIVCGMGHDKFLLHFRSRRNKHKTR